MEIKEHTNAIKSIREEIKLLRQQEYALLKAALLPYGETGVAFLEEQRVVCAIWHKEMDTPCAFFPQKMSYFEGRFSYRGVTEAGEIVEGYNFDDFHYVGEVAMLVERIAEHHY